MNAALATAKQSIDDLGTTAIRGIDVAGRPWVNADVVAHVVLAAVAADPDVQDLVAKAIFRDDPSNELNADQARFLANAVLRVIGGAP